MINLPCVTTSELKEVVGILQQKEQDLRNVIWNLDPLQGPKMVAQRTEELETEITRVRDLWNKLERG